MISENFNPLNTPIEHPLALFVLEGFILSIFKNEALYIEDALLIFNSMLLSLALDR